jgi:hypothetical protein
VPVEERSTRSAERCDQHPARSAVATCAGCGRPLCLTCAVPVRGAVLGVECLPEPLGDDPPPAPRAARRPPLQLVTAGALALALVATVVPWSRFGVGAGTFGAWEQAPRWSSLTAAAAVLGCLAWAARRLLLPARRWPGVAIAVLGGLVSLGAAMSIWHPPAFTRTWIGPWIALAAGVVACVSSVAAERTPRGPIAAPI